MAMKGKSLPDSISAKFRQLCLLFNHWLRQRNLTCVQYPLRLMHITGVVRKASIQNCPQKSHMTDGHSYESLIGGVPGIVRHWHQML